MWYEMSIEVKFKHDSDIPIVYGLYQYDYGQELVICGIDAENVTQVHFSAVNLKSALISTAQKTENGGIKCTIPDKCLEQGTDIIVYVYLSGEDFGKTIRQAILAINKRKKPEGYSPEQDKGILDKLISEIGGKADNIKIDGEYIQLLSGVKEIGDRVRIPAGEGGSSREIELKRNEDEIQWRYTDSNEWYTLVSLDELKGKDGQTPEFEIRNDHLFAIYQE